MTEPGQWVPVTGHDILSWTRDESSLRQPTDAAAGNTAPGLGTEEIHLKATQNPLRHKTRLFVRQFLNAQVQIGNMLIRKTFLTSVPDRVWSSQRQSKTAIGFMGSPRCREDGLNENEWHALKEWARARTRQSGHCVSCLGKQSAQNVILVRTPTTASLRTRSDGSFGFGMPPAGWKTYWKSACNCHHGAT